jgi:hypothetical protein
MHTNDERTDMAKPPLEGVDLDVFIRKALDEARLHADEPGPLSQNWSQLALAAAVYRHTQQQAKQTE